jgi:hypothetical protein
LPAVEVLVAVAPVVVERVVTVHPLLENLQVAELQLSQYLRQLWQLITQSPLALVEQPELPMVATDHKALIQFSIP